MKIKLKEILDSKDISIYFLSKHIGVSPNNLGKIVKGETTSIRFDILESICLFLNITPNDIFEIERYTANSEYQRLENRLREDTIFYKQMTTIASQYHPEILNMNYEEQLKFVINFILFK